MFAFHHINAYEDGTDLVLDLPESPVGEIEDGGPGTELRPPPVVLDERTVPEDQGQRVHREREDGEHRVPVRDREAVHVPGQLHPHRADQLASQRTAPPRCR
jgi:hypothetical protein